MLEAFLRDDGFVATKGILLQKYVPERLRDDEQVVREAVRKYGGSLEHASARLRDDKGFVLELVRGRSDSLLEHTSERLRDDQEIVLGAVRNDAGSLKHASERLRDDRVIVLAAVGADAGSFKYVSDRLRDDKGIVLAAVGADAGSFKYVSDRLRDDKVVVMKVVKTEGRMLEYASAHLRDDKEVVEAALGLCTSRSCHCAWLHASERLRKDREFVMKVIHISGEMLPYMSPRLRVDRAFVMEALQTTDWRILMRRALLDDKKFMMEVFLRLGCEGASAVLACAQQGIISEATLVYVLSNPKVTALSPSEVSFLRQYPSTFFLR